MQGQENPLEKLLRIGMIVAAAIPLRKKATSCGR